MQMYNYLFVISTRRWPVQARVAAIELKELPQRHRLVGRLVVLRINVFLAIFQLYRDLETGGYQFLKS